MRVLLLSSLLIPLSFGCSKSADDPDPIAGVRDSTTPADGYYYNTTMYVLTFGS